MLKLRVFLVAAMVLTACAAWAAPNVEKGGEPVPNMATLIQAGYAKCGFCTIMEQTIEFIDSEYKGRLAVRYVDVVQDSKFRNKYEIDAAPAQLLFDAKGKLVMKHIGFLTKDQLIELLKEHGVE